jgi:alkylation response protein AidB-like acyl-CoA dehydrogenase
MEQPPTITTESLLQAVETLRPILEAQVSQSETDRRLAKASYDAMRAAGLFRMLVPRVFGGMALHPVAAYKVWEAVARIDSTAAWNLLMATGIAGFAAWLPAAGGEEIFGKSPDVIAASGFFPPATAVPIDGGWRVTGRVPFASGCHQAQWLMMPTLVMDGDQPQVDPQTGAPRTMVAFFPRAEVEVIDTWHTLGMRGTFSADIAVNQVFVPWHRAGFLGSLVDPPAAFAAPLYRLWPWPAVHGEATVSLGIAAAAIAKLVTLAQTKTPAMSTTALRDREMAQHHAAKATALVDAAREYLHVAASEAYTEAERDGTLSQRTKMRCQLAACFAAEACAKAVDLVHQAAGTTGIRAEAGLERHFRDIHTLTQHASKSYARYESVGKMLFGFPPDWFVLSL